ncbi:MAG: IreB family regulatory phosphoprotein [Bacilli bacterium]|nr:IreB family regulatory phosphoprotein [Bacilli bacterium]
MSQEKTTLFNVQEIDAERTRVTLKEVYAALEERGYNPINQIVGYLISGDPGYISSYKDARNKIQEIERAKIVEILLVEFQKKNK